jgi:DNA-directed RNA polymerase subunit RPC12/RpoP
MIELQSTIACPKCGYRSSERMPTDACQYIYTCKRCSAELKPKIGDCCVYCSYGDVPCPPIQEKRSGHAATTARDTNDN